MRNDYPAFPGYDVDAEIGRGGMGIVYRVRRHSDGTVCAVKMISSAGGASFDELLRFRIEAEALACLDHPNVVKIRDFGLYAGCPFFAMDFAPGGSLKDILTRRPQNPMWAARLVRTLSEAIEHAHGRGLLHRDLKPANVLLMEDDTPVVTDFGLVKFTRPIRDVSEACCTMTCAPRLDTPVDRLVQEFEDHYYAYVLAQSNCPTQQDVTEWNRDGDQSAGPAPSTSLRNILQFLAETRHSRSAETVPDLDALTHSGAVLGSPSYMAPEQIAGDAARVGPRADVYALGGILYEALTGEPPFRPQGLSALCSGARTVTRPRAVAPEVSRDLEAVCLKCLEPSPDARYQSAAALGEDLSRVIDGYSPRATDCPPRGGRRVAPLKPNDRADSTRSWWPFGPRRSQVD